MRLGRYRLIEKLGQGGMAQVFLAEDEELHRTVAIKLMHQHLGQDPEGRERFVREARAIAALRHPNVLALYDYVPGGDDHPAYLVTELIRGPTLRQLLERHGPPPAEVAAQIGCKLALALHVAHEAGVVHRDVKPENVMVDEGGRLVLCDFGVARLIDHEQTMTQTGRLIGSPAYMSPEQAAAETVDPRSDLFSLGTLLYQLATGKLPFSAPQPLALLALIHSGKHLPPGAHNPRIPPYLERAIERCLEVARDARFADGASLAQALETGLRADGLGEIDRELGAYFHDPLAYAEKLERRVVASSLTRAEAAIERGDSAQALALCNRVLAFRPEDPTVAALLRRLGRRHRLRRGLLGLGGALLFCALALPLGWYWKGSANRAETHVQPVNDYRSQLPSAPPPSSISVSPAAPSSLKPAPSRSPAAAARPLKAPATAETPLLQQRRNTSSVRATPTTRVASVPPAASPSGASPPAPNPSPPATPMTASSTPATAPTEGELLLRARPWCNGTVDGQLPISDLHPLVRLGPGPHRVRCQGPQHAEEEKIAEVKAGERVVVHFDFSETTLVPLRLARGDAVAFGNAPPSEKPQRLTTGVAREVRLFHKGQEIDHGYVDILPGCVLVDTPRLDCRKP